jgi:chromosomal replication initiation ATPase DnaA
MKNEEKKGSEDLQEQQPEQEQEIRIKFEITIDTFKKNRDRINELIEELKIKVEPEKIEVVITEYDPNQIWDSEKIINIVCQYFNFPVDLIDNPCRKREIVQVKQIAQFLARALTNESLSHIAETIGGMNHATILSSTKTIRNLYKTNWINTNEQSKSVKIHFQDLFNGLIQTCFPNQAKAILFYIENE